MKSKSRRSSFTLVEICVAVLVLGLGLVSLLSVFPVALKWSGEANSASTSPAAAMTVYHNICAAYTQADNSGYTTFTATDLWDVSNPWYTTCMDYQVYAHFDQLRASGNIRLYEVQVNCYTDTNYKVLAGAYVFQVCGNSTCEP